jgi:hypothetical protein
LKDQAVEMGRSRKEHGQLLAEIDVHIMSAGKGPMRERGWIEVEEKEDNVDFTIVDITDKIHINVIPT